MSNRRIAVALLAVATLIGSACGSSSSDTHRSSPTTTLPFAQSATPELTITARGRGVVIPAGFVGLSLEADQLGTPLLDPATSDLPEYLRHLGAGDLGIGGNTSDDTAAWQADRGHLSDKGPLSGSDSR